MVNVYLHFRDNRTLLWQNIASELKDRGIANKIGASVVGRKGYEFLKEQNEIDYHHTCLEANLRRNFSENELNKDRLDQLESLYGTPSLNFFFTIAGRFGVDDISERQTIVQHWFDYYIDLFDSFEPDVFLTDDVGHLSKVVPFYLTKKDHGLAVRWHSTRISNRYAFSSTLFDQFDDIQTLYSDFVKREEKINNYESAATEAYEYLRTFRQQGIKPGYTREINQDNTSSLPSKLNSGLKYPIQSYKHDYKNDYMQKTTGQMYENQLLRAFRRKRANLTNFFDSANSTRYVFFPLHLQPEWSTLVLAQPYMDQTLAVKQVADNLPVGFELLVKDHPRMFGTRPISYYKRLKQIPKVQVLDPRVDSFDLINDSDLVSTITGTAGLEAILLSVPSVVFGDPYFSELPDVERVSNPYNIEEAIYRKINKSTVQEHDTIQFLTAVFEHSFESRYPSRITEDQVTEEAKKIVENLLNFKDIGRESR